MEAVLDRSVRQVGAPAARRAGHTGKGTKVAVLDTGVDASHPDLSDAVAEAKVLRDDGFGAESEVLAGMEWAAQRADVVTMSLGGGDNEDVDPLERAVNRLTEQTGAR